MHGLSELLTVWLQFGICALLIAFAGSRLSRYGDVIAEKTGLSGSWIGVILLATVTSLPELVTGVSAVTLADAPDIAVGNVLGSCMVNLAMLVIVDLLYRRESFYRCVGRGHILSAAFGIVLIGLSGVGLLLGTRGVAPAIAHVGMAMPVIVLLYVVAIRIVLHFEREQMQEFAEETAERYPELSLRQAVARYAIAAAVVVGAGVWLPFIGEQLAAVMGWRGSFVGTLFIAGATTLPELAVTISALRIGALNMAIANLLGSNLFNILILAIDDLFFLRGPLFAHVSSIHAVSAFSAVMMTSIAMIGLLYRPRVRLLHAVGWISVGLFSIYVLNSYILYRYGT